MPRLRVLLTAAVAVTVALVCTGNVAGLELEDFLGGRPLSKERVVTDMLAYYQKDSPMGIPVLEIPEPLVVPLNVSVSGLELNGLNISGFSTFRLEYVNVNVTSLTATILLRLSMLEVLSNYEMSTYWSTVMGELNCTFLNLDIKVDIELGPGYDRKMEVQDLQVTVTKDAFLLYFSETSMAISLIQAAADSFFDTIVGMALGRRMDALRERLNTRLADRLKERYFPEGIKPVDLLLAGVKRDLLAKYDPHVIGSKTISLPAGVTLVLSDITVTGLSSLHRTHEVSLQFIDDRLLAIVQLGCQTVTVRLNLETSVSVLPPVSTSVEFVIDGLTVWVELQQAADVTYSPYLRRLHITLGNFHLTSTGEGSLNYLLEAGVSGLANGLRGTIVRRLEPRIQQVVQRRLNNLDVEGIIKKRLNLQ